VATKVKVNKELEKLISASVIKEVSTAKLETAVEFLEALQAYKTNFRLKNTYTKGIRKAYDYNDNGKIYCSYKFDMARTGRLTCSSYSAGKRDNPLFGTTKAEKEKKIFPMGVSFHTLPRETDVNIRDAFVAPEGWVYITADFSAAELRILTHIADEAAMRKAFVEGLDLHSYAASLLYDKDIELVDKDERQIAKAVSFLIVFGGDEHTLSEKHAVSLYKAKEIIDKYLEVFPGVKGYIEARKQEAMENGFVESIFGRRRNLGNVRSGRKYIVERALRQAVNAPVQSSASDMIICCIISIDEEFGKRGMLARIDNSVHDSIELVCPKNEMVEVLEIIHYHMVVNPYMKSQFGIELSVPMSIDAEVGKSFGTGKEVEYTEDGRVLNKEELLEL